MVLKKVDPRVRILIENCVKTGQRSLFVILGGHARDQVVNIHYILSKASVKARPTVLWCYKKELGFSSNRKKRMKMIQKKHRHGALDIEGQSAFDLFVSSTDVRYTYYKESHKVLGQTFGMCVLQDFEGITPNLLARTVETVEGGGAICLLVSNASSVQQLYSLTMDVHTRFRTEAHSEIVPRFNERFLLSLGSCETALVVDDGLNLLPVSTTMRNLKQVQLPCDEDGVPLPSEKGTKLAAVLEENSSHELVGLLKLGRTTNQVEAILSLLSTVQEKMFRTTVAITASRGRGKSAALGLAVAGAIFHGYSNIFVTAPSAENVHTFFEFVVKGIEEIGYVRHMNFETIEGSSDPDSPRSTIRLNIFKNHRQTVEFISPEHAERLGHPELLVIDEAGAIPLTLVRKLLGPYLVFLSSTINGYEGTGRSLSLKLISELRSKSSEGSLARGLREISLSEPIRYSEDDPVERWMYDLLCLDSVKGEGAREKIPLPAECELYYVNRDTLFSFHRATEAFLHSIMALFVASHYKNSPNDLQMLSDAPAHHIFVLLGPVSSAQKTLPDVLCAIQLCFEGSISSESASDKFARGLRPMGDLIPWTMLQTFQDKDFAALCGARVVRIASHPDYMRMGYGSRALELLKGYFACPPKIAPSSVADAKSSPAPEAGKLRTSLPPLLQKLGERQAERLHYLGTSYGVTSSLFSFWSKAGFSPVYLRQTPNELTGEFTCVMLHELPSRDDDTIVLSKDWVKKYNCDFRKRFFNLLGYDFRGLRSALALSLIGNSMGGDSNKSQVSGEEIAYFCSPHDLRRLESYAKNLVDYRVILDVVPDVARLFFNDRLKVSLSVLQQAVLVGIGFRRVTFSSLSEELNLPPAQLLAIFNKMMRKISSFIRSLSEIEAEQEINVIERAHKVAEIVPSTKNLKDDLDSTAITKEMQKYAIRGDEGDWDAVLDTDSSLKHVSVKSKPKERAGGEGNAKSRKRKR